MEGECVILLLNFHFLFTYLQYSVFARKKPNIPTPIMCTHRIIKLAALSLALVPGISAFGQTYSNVVASLTPYGYWPLNETVVPSQPLNLTANNLGTLGATGNGSYGAWYQPAGNQWYLTNNIIQVAGATADGDKAMTNQFAPGQYVILPRNTNGVANTAITINAPFSIEAWLNVGTTASRLGDIVSEGQVQLNTGGPNTNNPYYGGQGGNGSGGSSWAGFELGQYANFFFFSCYNTNAYNSKASELDSPKNLVVGQWVHLVVTFDGSYETMYENGVQVGQKRVSANLAGLTYVPDPTAPLMIGAGGEPSVTYGTAFAGTIDEVAIYPEVLSQASIVTHYQTAGGTNATYGSDYRSSVLADSPTIYFRLDDAVSQTSAAYQSSALPVASNYGSAGAVANGAYQPGTYPGAAGPNYAGFGANSRSVAINGWLGAVDIGNSNIPAALNPTGASPLTVISWFQTGPADAPGRFQEILGHSDSSYRLSLGQQNGGGDFHFNPGPGPELQFTSGSDVATNGFAFNDGQWHMIAGVSDGTNEYLYLDGALAKTNGNAAGINITGTTRDLLLGGDPQYTFASRDTVNTIRNFDGQIAQVAYWTNALSPSQIQQIYNAASMPPYSWPEPVSSITINAGQNLAFPANIRGSAVAYQWYRNGVPVAGQTNFNLTYTPISTSAAGSYFAVGTGSGSSVTSSVVNVTVYGSPTVAQQTPTQLNIFAGSSPTLHVTALGATPIYYQWSLNGTAITGATNASLTLVNIQNNGTYTCVMTNLVGTGAINPISVTVLTDPSAPFPSQVLADGPIAYFRLDEAAGTTAYDYVGGNNGTYTNVALGMPGYDSLQPTQSDPTETAAGFGFINPPNDYVGNVPTYLNFGAPNGSNSEFSVEAWATDYINNNNSNAIVALGYGNGGEQFVLDTGNGASGTLRFFVRNAAGTVSSAGSSVQIGNDGLWHHIVGVCDEAGGHIYLYMDGKQVGSGTITAGSGLLSSSTPLSIGARQSSNFGNTNYDYQFYGSVDDVAVYNKALSAAQVQAHYYAQGQAPLITGFLPSSNWTTNQGADASFTVSVGGTAPFTYQWTDNNGNVIPWANGATLVLTNVQPGQAGNYTVGVSNPYGGPVYTNLNLMITQVPQVISDITPSNVAVYASEPVTLSVTIAGTAPLHYQWYQNGVAIPGATNTAYTVAALTGANTYYLSVTNQYSAGNPTLSSTATITGMPAAFLTPSSYSDNMKVTFKGYSRSETLQDFPVLIRLSTNLPGFNYSHFSSPSGADLRFTDAGGTRIIPSEIDQWNPNGESTVWVQVPALSGTNTTIWAYWGNSSATTALPGTNVWVPQPWEGLPAYDAVYHLKEGALPFADSTGNYPFATGVPPGQAPGSVSFGALFDGTSDFLDAGIPALGKQFTLSAWVNIASNAVSEQMIWCNKSGGWNTAGFAFYVNSWQASDGIIYLDTSDGVGGQVPARTAAHAVSFGQWHLLTGTLDGSNGVIHVYIDGADQTLNTSVDTAFQVTNYLRSGSLLTGTPGTSGAGGSYFNGVMDESRIRSGIESSNWIWASWMTVQQNSSLATYSSITSTITNSPTPVTIHVGFSAGNGGSLALSGTGGSAGGTYYIVGTTNLALPVTQWTVLSTNSFDGSGNFNISVPVVSTNPNVFLRIKE